MWIATIFMALRELRRNVMRSALTTLGIVIGVASVIAMVTLGRSATARVTQDIASLGQNMLMVFPGSDRRGPVSVAATPFRMDDVRAIEKEVGDLATVAPTSSKSELIVYGNANHTTAVYGATNTFFVVRSLKIQRGRDFSDAELAGGNPACVLGETVRKELFGMQEALDSSIRVGAVACRVVGILEAKGQNTFGQDQDDFIVMPLTTLQRRLAGNSDIGMMYVSVAEEKAIARTKARIQNLLRDRRRIQPGQTDDFNVQDTKEIAKTVSSVTGVLTALLGAVAAVSLLVGGIGIMNIMLVAVTERTREIGIRLSIGALASEVLMQFLVESIMLCTLGGVIGVSLGLLGSYGATRALSMPFEVDPVIVLVAFFFSAAIGIAFGYLPARKAARLNPIEALRHE
ncbi:MAG: multidrug ABC transporter substrate-binding protein [Myxococcales bacterium 68-20]|nr:ABC transporter permease [Myxococcales bacterium]OJY15754.1 MAG: multidrug ABC transporter substrate-binding protein [Myxococcales bacterium 68-20]